MAVRHLRLREQGWRLGPGDQRRRAPSPPASSRSSSPSPSSPTAPGRSCSSCRCWWPRSCGSTSSTSRRASQLLDPVDLALGVAEPVPAVHMSHRADRPARHRRGAGAAGRPDTAGRPHRGGALLPRRAPRPNGSGPTGIASASTTSTCASSSAPTASWSVAPRSWRTSSTADGRTQLSVLIPHLLHRRRWHRCSTTARPTRWR